MARILLIDDDEMLLDTVSQMLALDGHSVRTVGDGAQGIKAFRQGQDFDLVITDMLMPAVDGAQVIVEIKRLRADIPVVAISGGRRAISPQFNLDTAELVGAAQLLSKPFGRPALKAAVDKALRGSA
jgi:CheY-like chemotaxis protein